MHDIEMVGEMIIKGPRLLVLTLSVFQTLITIAQVKKLLVLKGHQPNVAFRNAIILN